jgi:hypothetical protein
MNEYSGNGTIKYINGDVYEGEFKDSTPHGEGKMTFIDDGRVCEGNWKGGKLQKGTCKWKDGSVYEGELVDGKPHGKGKLTSSIGNVYEGYLKDGVCHERGTYKWSVLWPGRWSGCMYQGEWKDGEIHGKGVMTYANKDVYDGEWINDKAQGQGVMTYHNGDIYSGEWSDDKQHGKGTFEYAGGDVWKSIGEWKEGKKDGVFEDLTRKQVVYENDEVKTNVKPESTSDIETDTEETLSNKRVKK